MLTGHTHKHMHDCKQAHDMHDEILVVYTLPIVRGSCHVLKNVIPFRIMHLIHNVHITFKQVWFVTLYIQIIPALFNSPSVVIKGKCKLLKRAFPLI